MAEIELQQPTENPVELQQPVEMLNEQDFAVTNYIANETSTTPKDERVAIETQDQKKKFEELTTEDFILQSRKALDDYLVSGVSDGSITAKNVPDILEAWKETTRIDAVNASFTDEQLSKVDGYLDLTAKDAEKAYNQYYKRVLMERSAAEAYQAYEESPWYQKVGVGLRYLGSQHLSGAMERSLMASPEFKDTSYIDKFYSSDMVLIEQRYWNNVFETLPLAEAEMLWKEHVDYLKKSFAPGRVDQYLQHMTQPYNSIERGFEALDWLLPMGIGSFSAAKAGILVGAKEGAKAGVKAGVKSGLLNTAEFFIPGVGLTAEAGKILSRSYLKEGRPILTTKAERAKQLGKYDEAAEETAKEIRALSEDSPAATKGLVEGEDIISKETTEQVRAVLNGVAPVTKTSGDFPRGIDLTHSEAVAAEVKRMQGLQGIVMLARSVESSVEEYFKEDLGKILDNITKNTKIKRENVIGLQSVLPDGSGAWVRLGKAGSLPFKNRAAAELFAANHKLEKNMFYISPLENPSGGFVINLIYKDAHSMFERAPLNLRAYKSIEEARKVIADKKLSGLAKIEEIEGGFYKIVPTTKNALPDSVIGGSSNYKPVLGYLSTVLSSISSGRGLSHLALRDQGFISRFVNERSKQIGALGKKDMAVFNQIFSESKYFFYTSSHLRRAGINEKVIAAYEAARDINDVAWLVKALDSSASMKIEGMLSVWLFGVPKAFGRRLDPTKIRNPERSTWVVFEGSTTTKIPLKSENILEAYPPSQYEYIALSVDHAAGGRNIIVKKDAVSFKELPDFPMHYNPGFRHWYDKNSLFIKISQFSYDGEKVLDLDSIITLAASTDAKKALKFTKELNKAYQIACKWKGDVSKGSAAFEKANFEVLNRDYKEFLGVLADNHIKLDSRFQFEALKNGVTPKAVTQHLADIAIDQQGIDEVLKNSFRSLQKTEGELRKMQKTKSLLNLDLESEAQLMSPSAIMVELVDNIVSTVGIKAARRIAGDDFRKRFKEVLNPRDLNRLTPEQLIMYGEITEPASVLGQRAKIAQEQAHLLANTPTSTDMWINDLFNSVKDLLIESGKISQGGKIDAILTDLPLKTVRFARTVVFHELLGCLNPRPFFQNVMSTIYATSISPVAGFKAMAITPRVMSMLKKQYSTEVLKDTAKFLTRVSGEEYTDEATRLLMNSINALPVHELGINYSGLAEGITHVGKKFQDISAKPFLLGEIYCRTQAAVTTYLEAKAKHPDIDFSKLSQKDLAYYTNRMQNLYNNMSRASVAPIQRGMIGSVAFQMMGYQMRSFEALFNNTLSIAERSRLFTTALILTGTEGLIGAKATANIYSYLYNDPGEAPDEFFDGVSRGLLATAAESLGVDLNPGEMIGFNWENLVDFDMFTSTEGTPVFSKLNGVLGAAANSYNAVCNTLRSDVPLTEAMTMLPEMVGRAIYENGLLPSSVNRAYRAYIMGKEGLYKALNGQILVDNMSPEDAMLYGAGFNPIDVEDLRMYSKVIANSKEKVKAAAEGLFWYAKDFLENPTEETETKFRNARALLTGASQENPSGRFTNAEIKELYELLKKRFKQQKLPSIDRMERLLFKMHYEKDIERMRRK